ncbi:MAG: hypothetical protein JNL43_07060 [Flavobacteriales bacterium]|nr:hypothetical protein [Flavobacteriales bacterium]
MRITSAVPFLLLGSYAYAQVELSTPIRFTGGTGDRGATGTAAPVEETGALTVEASVLGGAHWTTASVVGNTITLSAGAPVTTYRDGVLLRFVAPVDLADSTWLVCPGHAPLPVLRPDGIPPVSGQMVAGAVCEVILAADRWILINAPDRGCPPGTTTVNDRLCIETVPTGNMYFFPAVERCAALGGGLCRWDEYYLACTRVGSQLSGLFTAWEWIDDSSNHANTAVHVGRTTCTDQKWADPQSITFGITRCCFHPK